MDEIKVTSLTSKLTVLDVAKSRVRSAEESLSCAKSVYSYAIRLLEDAMMTDETVIECQELVDEYQDMYIEALHQAQSTAVLAWEGGFTNGKKEWTQDEWEVRLRTTRFPKVINPETFTAHLQHLEADVNNIIKSITLHKANTNKLNEGISGGLSGLDIEQKTSCSLKREGDG